MNPLTILIIEDDESMRDTVEALLKNEYRIVKAVDGREAMKELKENEVQIALIDIRLPDIRGTEILKTIKREKPDIECIIMSAINDAETAAECFKNGALDYLTKEFDYDIFRQRIKNAARLYYKKKQIRHLQRRVQMLEAEVEKLKSPSPESSLPYEKDFPPSTFPAREEGHSLSSSPHMGEGWGEGDDYLLTEREIEILKLKAGGLKNSEIADKLSISPITVKNHIHNILHKFNTQSIFHAIALAYEKGILKISKRD